MTEQAALIRKHRSNGILIDANLLLLYVVGMTNEQRIARFKKTDAYTVHDFRILQSLISEFQEVVTTPHILTEVSNLAKLTEPELSRLRHRFRTIVDASSEIVDTSRAIMAAPVFLRLGLADAAIFMAAKNPMLVLTADLDLYRTLRQAGVDAINFTDLRTWLLPSQLS
jgi:predicted nucleic acid-binding protein